MEKGVEIEIHQKVNGRDLSRDTSEMVATITNTGIINRLYTIQLHDFGFAFSRAICVIVKYVDKSLLKTVISVLTSLIFYWQKTYHEKSVIWNWAVG